MHGYACGQNSVQLYTTDGQPLNEITEHKDLGVVFDKMLKFHSHVSMIVSKAKRIMGMIKKALLL